MSKLAWKVALRYLKKADLNPPLGYGSGVCNVVQRVEKRVHNPRVEDQLVQMVEHGRDIPNSVAAKVYPRIRVKGAWKFNFILSSHTQYRMDLREVTLPEIRSAIDRYFRQMNQARSRGDTQEWMLFDSGVKRIIEDSRLRNLTVVFNREGKDILIQTAYRKGERDPRGPCIRL